MATEGSEANIDIGALQAQLELNRSLLADKILAKLPAPARATPSKASTSRAPEARPPTLGLGAKLPTSAANAQGHTSSGKSVADVRLMGKLTAKRKRGDADMGLQSNKSATEPTEEESDEEGGRAGMLGKNKKHAKASNDPFASTKKHKTAAPPALPKSSGGAAPAPAEGDGVDMSKLSKTQRKKLNKKRRAEAEAQTVGSSSQLNSSSALLNGSPEKEQDADAEMADADDADAASGTTSHLFSDGLGAAASIANGKSSTHFKEHAKGKGKEKKLANGSVSGPETTASKDQKSQNETVGQGLQGETKAQAKKRRREEVQRAATAASEDGAATTSSAPGPSTAVPSSSPPPALPTSLSQSTTSSLTPLQAQMLRKLSGARFRWINERLYTAPSSEALRLMRDDSAMMEEYHSGFREQVKSWPLNPVERIAEILMPPSASSAAGQKGKKGKATATGKPGAVVVDLGAGDAGLARKLVPHGVRVLSFDLLDSPDGWVRGADVASPGGLPLPGVHPYDVPAQTNGKQGAQPSAYPAIADVAVFSLSLMGTNWVEAVIEARRVLRVG